MTTVQVNYQQLFEDEMDEVTKQLMSLPPHYFDLPEETKRFVEELVDLGYRRAIEDVLDPEVLADTAALSGEMGTQLYNFANMLESFLSAQNNGKET